MTAESHYKPPLAVEFLTRHKGILGSRIPGGLSLGNFGAGISVPEPPRDALCVMDGYRECPVLHTPV